ncbi:MAG: glycosyl hydrolase [Bacteroidota bacterium]|nr:glycosyl hydrolase [Bacteroidota bacterium]
MKRTFYLQLIVIIAFSGFFSCNSINNEHAEPHAYASLSDLKQNFLAPPTEYGVNCWWWWLNGNVNKEGISKDLEAMKSRNFHGAMIFDAGGHNQRGNKDIPDGPLYGSHEWNELFVFALDEARRLDLEMGFNIQSGWNLGGPRVTPQYAAKQITSNGTIVQGGGKIIQKLEQPPIRFDFYEDIAILAVPLKDESQVVDGISDLSLKLGFHELGGSAPDCRFLLTNDPRNPSNPDIKPTVVVKQSEIIDLSAMLDASGVLTWDAPEGEWSVIRLGYTCTNSHVSTSSNQWKGLVLDYMSKEAFHFYWNDVVAPIFEAAGDHIGTTLKYMETDSWECGGMNWTDQFAAEFTKYRGYEIKSFLPVLAGIVVDDIETSNAFLADFRKTLGDLVAYNHYALFAEYADKHNMGIQPESAGPHAGPMDGIKNYGFSEIVMSEFWSPSPHRPRPENRYFLKQASSAAHIYGKKIVGAESFTTIGPHWNDELWHDQKSAFDHEICAGLNRLYFHTFTASPPEMGLPGQEYFAGTHVNPQVTWWDHSGPFIDYMHRTQSLVQNGKFVADVLYYYGDHVPNVFSIKATDPAGAIPGFDYDVTDENILLQLEVRKGKLVVPGGIEYQVLVLPDHRTLSMAALEKVDELLKAGAQVIGYKPEQLISQVGGDEGQKEFHELADKIWGEEVQKKGEKQVSKGTLAWGIKARDFLLSKNIDTDFEILHEKNSDDFDYIHYMIDGKNIYFITNQTTERQTISCQFRVSGHQPELWDALSGNIREAKAFSQEEDLTIVPLTLEPYGAVFVVFNEEIKKNQQGTGERNYHDFESLQTINGEWKVNFDLAWGPFGSAHEAGNGEFVFPELLDWSLHSNEAIKYYSGSAVYQKVIDLDFELKDDQKYYLQLGSVKDVGIAVVKVNGKDLGVTWTSPFRVDVSDALKAGKNELEIEVINSWYNRVAGDEILELEQPYTSTNIVLAHDFRGRKIENVKLEPSGLIGPAQIVQELRTENEELKE